MGEYYKKNLLVIDMYQKNTATKEYNNGEYKIHFNYTSLGKGIFIKNKHGYKCVTLNKYMSNPTPKMNLCTVIDESSIVTLESHLKNYPPLNNKNKNWYSLEEIIKLQIAFNKDKSKQNMEVIK